MTDENGKRLDSFTQMAIQSYARMLMAEKRAEKCRKECEDMTRGIDQVELAEYVRITTEMDSNMDKWGSVRAPSPKGV